MPGLTERNKAHWDTVADSYADKNQKTIEELIAEIQSRRDWIGVDFLDEDEGDEEADEIADADERANEAGGDGGEIERKKVKLLDYACGPGMISRALAPYVSRTLGIDLSASMVSVYNRNAHNQGLTPEFMAATVGNLLEPADPSPALFASSEWFNFDLAVVGLGFHHFEDPGLAAARLAERLRPGGVLMIIDFMPHSHEGGIEADIGGGSGEGSSHSHGHGQGILHGQHHGHGYAHHGHGEHSSGPQQESTDDLKQNASDRGLKEAMHTIAHNGFSKDDIYDSFEKAGVGKDFAFDVLKRDIVFRTNDRKITRQVFFARGTKGQLDLKKIMKENLQSNLSNTF